MCFFEKIYPKLSLYLKTTVYPTNIQLVQNYCSAAMTGGTVAIQLVLNNCTHLLSFVPLFQMHHSNHVNNTKAGHGHSVCGPVPVVKEARQSTLREWTLA